MRIAFATIVVLLCFSCTKKPDNANRQLNASPSSLSLAFPAGSTDTFAVTSNTSWRIAIDTSAVSWLSTSSLTGNGSGKVIVTSTKANTGAGPRTAKVTMTTTDGGTTLSTYVTVTQREDSSHPVFSADSTFLTIGPGVMQNDSFFLRSTFNWVAQDSGKYCSISITNGNGDARIYVAVRTSQYFSPEHYDTLVLAAQPPANVAPIKIVVRLLPGVITHSFSNAYGGTMADRFRSAVRTPDNGIIAVGTTASSDGDVAAPAQGPDLWVVKMDINGTLQWQKKWGGSGTEEAMAVVLAKDGTYAIAGYTTSTDGAITNAHGKKDGWLLDIDQQGNIVWQKTFGGSGDDYFNSVSATSDGGFVAAGASTSADGDLKTNYGSNDAWLVRLDAQGNLLWTKTFGGAGTDVINKVITSTEGGFAMAGSSSSKDSATAYNDSFTFVAKLDEGGNEIWQQIYGVDDGQLDEAVGVVETPDLHYVIARNVTDTITNGNSTVYITTFNTSGAQLTDNSFPSGIPNYIVNSINLSEDNGIMLTGYFRNYPAHVRISKLTPEGKYIWSQLLATNLFYDYLYNFVSMGNGVYMAVGETFDYSVARYHGVGDAWVLKIQD